MFEQFENLRLWYYAIPRMKSYELTIISLYFSKEWSESIGFILTRIVSLFNALCISLTVTLIIPIFLVRITPLIYINLINYHRTYYSNLIIFRNPFIFLTSPECFQLKSLLSVWKFFNIREMNIIILRFNDHYFINNR